MEGAMFRRIGVSTLFLACFVLNSAIVQAQQRVALVIGNANYQKGQLFGPDNDAKDVSAALRSAGLRQDDLVNKPTFTAMEIAIAHFRHNLDRDTVELVYYSGHGVQN